MHEVFSYVPNLIGYGRALLLVAFYVTALDHWVIAISCYLLSFAGDLFDGYYARKLNQSSVFGMVLDMVVDRVATAGFLSILCVLYPHRSFVFLCLQTLDLASHWLHVYSCAGAGHHKSKETLAQRNFVLKIYYASYPFFAYLCASCEFTYVALYVLHFSPELDILQTVYLYVLLPGCVMKQIVNVAQLVSASNDLASRSQRQE